MSVSLQKGNLLQEVKEQNAPNDHIHSTPVEEKSDPSLGRPKRWVKKDKKAPADKVGKGGRGRWAKKNGEAELQSAIADLCAQQAASRDVQREKEREAKEAEEKIDPDSLRVIPWLLLGGKYEKEGPYFRYLDGPNKQAYRLLPVSWNDQYKLLSKHSYTVCVVGHVHGNDDHLNPTWDMRQEVQRAAEVAVPSAIGLKSDLDFKNLVPLVENSLSQKVALWPDVKQYIHSYLLSEDFTRRVVEFNKQRLHVAPQLMKARLYRFGATIDATEKEVELAYRMYKTKFSFWFLIFRLTCYVLLTFFTFNSHFLEWSSIPMVAWVADVLHISRREFSSVISRVLRGILSYFIERIYRHYFEPNEKVRKMISHLKEGGSCVKYASVINVPSTCSGPCVKEPGVVNELGSYLFKFFRGDQHLACKDKEDYHPYGSVIEGAPMVIPKGCHHDEANGMIIRFLGAREQVGTEGVVRDVINYSKTWLLPLFAAMPAFYLYSVGEWLAHLNGKRRSMLANEPEVVDVSSAAPIDIFVKMEAYLGKLPSNFKPRLIMGRRLGFQNVVGAFMYSVSKYVGKVLNRFTDHWYVSSADALEVGAYFHRMFLERNFVFESDVSNWDGSLHPMWRSFEIWFIEHCVPYICPRWLEIKSTWFKTTAVGSKGVKMVLNWCRHSGDMWTSFLNSIINLCIVMYVAFVFGLGRIKIAVLGDDNGWACENQPNVDAIVKFYSSIGMKVVIKQRFRIEEMEFCSGRFYWTEAGYKWGVKPFRVLAKFGLNLHRHPKRLHKRLLFGTALSMLPIARHVPILGEFLQAVVDSGHAQKLEAIFDQTLSEPWRIMGSSVHEPTPQAYEDFARHYQFEEHDMLMLLSFVEDHKRSDLLDLFPMVLDHEVFRRGFAVDADCDLEHYYKYDYVARVIPSKKLDVPLYELVGAPVIEEVVKQTVPYSGEAIALYEALRDNSYLKALLHLFLKQVGRYNLLLAICLHFIYNVFVWMVSDDYVKLASILTTLEIQRSLAKVGVVFTTVVSYVPTINNWLTSSGFWQVKGPAVVKMLNNLAKTKTKSTKSKKTSTQTKKSSTGRNLLKGGLGTWRFAWACWLISWFRSRRLGRQSVGNG